MSSHKQQGTGRPSGRPAPGHRGRSGPDRKSHVESRPAPGHALPAGACAHAVERAGDAPEALATAERLCLERGVRMTPIRRSVLTILYGTHRPLGAYDLVEALARTSRRRIAPITVYRALDFLTEQGFVHRLATKNAFVACPHRHDPNDTIVFLICESCGGVDEAASPQVSGALGGILSEHAFRPQNQIVEIAGLCSHCAPARGTGDRSRP